MKKREQVLCELAENPLDNDMQCLFDHLDTYYIAPPPIEATKLLLQNIKPILVQETSHVKQGQRFRDIIAENQREDSMPAILLLIGPQATLMSRWFVVLTIAIIAGGLMVTGALENDVSRFLIIISPILGLLTLFYTYRSQVYRVEEMEAVCIYSPMQVATARLLVVLGYTILLCLIATLVVQSAHNVIVWKLILSWLAPLLCILGMALCLSVLCGIIGSCLVAAVFWIGRLTLLDGDSFIQVFLPNLSSVTTDVSAIFFGVVLIYLSIRFCPEEWLEHAR